MRLRGLSSFSNPYGFRSIESVPAAQDGFSAALLTSDSSRRRCRLLIATPQVRAAYSTVYPVRDGVMLKPETILEGQPGKIFFACANHLRTDLSGLAIIRDDAWQRMVQELSQRLGA
jgi:hypothetical protein